MEQFQPTNIPAQAHQPQNSPRRGPPSQHELKGQPVKWKPIVPQLPETPIPLSIAEIPTQPMPSIVITPGMPVRTPYPGRTPIRRTRRYVPSRARPKEPGVGETLMGCGMLMVIGILGLLLLYYLAMGA